MFLDWLLDTLEQRQIDVLVIAGDVFDSMHPSAEALAQYYRFVARVAGTGIRDVVVIGGNHDSASRLDAPEALLQAVDVHVVGGVPAEGPGRAKMVVPLRARGSEEVAAVCIAVPYVHEYRLGIRTTDLDEKATRAAFKKEFSRLYTELCEQAQSLFPGVPIVATGHLTLGSGSKREDYPQEIHQVGTIAGLAPEILDPRIQYAALGHIHRCYRVEGSAAWYCGSPIAYSLPEMNRARQVLIAELDSVQERDGEQAGEASVERLPVPELRQLVQLKGTADEVCKALDELTWKGLPPLVHVQVETQLADPGLNRRLHQVIEDRHRAASTTKEGAEASSGQDGRPILVEVRQVGVGSAESAERPVARLLKELQPTEVFAQICDLHQLTGEELSELQSAFATLASATDDLVKEMCADVGNPEPAPQTLIEGGQS